MNPSHHFGLLGERISYTKSPDIFAEIGKSLNLDIRFDVLDVSSDRIDDMLERLRSGQLDGLSVTIPHKELVCAHMSSCSAEAAIIGAVNCVVHEEVRLVGHNTDWEGFVEPLQILEEKLFNARVLVFGSGGAARAAVYGLRARLKVQEIIVVSRDLGRQDLLRTVAGEMGLRHMRFDQTLQVREALSKCALIVNATPLGGANYPDGGELLKRLGDCRDAIYYDLNYSDNNRLIGAARALGCMVIDGKRMLVAQALKAFTLWTGLQPLFEPIYQAVFGERRRQD